MTIKIEVNTGLCALRFGIRFMEAQRYLDSEVLRCCAPFVPMRTGNLMRSGNTGTRIGSGEVIYNAPYAKKCFYGRNFNFSKDKHPLAQAYWLTPAKAQHLDEWAEGLQKILCGEGA